jgi:adenylyl- and sulfurtransferase ThiI
MKNATNTSRELDKSTIQTFAERIGGFAWSNDFFQFCQVLELNPEHSYSIEKWQQLQQLNKALSQFDTESLHKIIEARRQQVSQQ